MLPVILLGAVLWGIGMLTGAPIRARLTMLGLLYAAVLLVHLVLPDGAALRAVTGGSAAPWLVAGGVVALIGGYRYGLNTLRDRAAAAAITDRAATDAAPARPGGSFSEAELDRYARHIVLREIGGPGQKALRNARVLVVGAGGLGSPALLYLAASGVGTLGVIDGDTVDRSNLQRQVIHTEDRIGMPKVFSAQMAVRALNPHVLMRPYNRRLDETIAADLFADYDLILDGTDNFDTRYLVNRTAVAAGKPLIASALTQWEGQIGLYHPAGGGPCLECVFPERPAPGLVPACAEAGVAAPLPGVMGAMMAMEALKLICGAGDVLRGRLLIHDCLFAESRIIGVKPRAKCPVCGGRGAPAAGPGPA